MLHNRRVLVVDSNEDSRGLLDVVLRSENADVLLTSSVSQALENLIWYNPHIVLTELVLPHEDGFSLIQKIRQMSKRQLNLVPVVAITGWATQTIFAETQQAGFQACLLKPFDFNQLVQAVQFFTTVNLSEIEQIRSV